jgi:hypothetical protein
MIAEADVFIAPEIDCFQKTGFIFESFADGVDFCRMSKLISKSDVNCQAIVVDALDFPDIRVV